MTETLVWVFRVDPRVGGQTGFVTCEQSIADALIADGVAQDTSCGAHHLSEIDLSAYEVKVMSASSGGRRRATAHPDAA